MKQKKIKMETKDIFELSKSTHDRRIMTIAMNHGLNSQYNEKRIHQLMMELDVQCAVRREKKVLYES